MGKIGDLVNRIISPLLNRSTNSQTVADPRRGRIGYVGNITLISQLINDVGYTTSEGTVTDVDIRAGKFKGWEDIAPAEDELIPKFNVPTKTSHLTNNGDGTPTIPQYGTGTITGLKRITRDREDIGGVTIENGVAKIKIGTDMGDYSNDNTFSKNPGIMSSLEGVAGSPLIEVGSDTPRFPDGTAYKYIIHIPTSTNHVTDNKYVNNYVFNNIYKFVFNNITVNNSVITPIGTLYDQNFINSYIKIYTFGKIVFIYGDVPSFTITTANINVLNNMQILEIKESGIFMQGPSVNSSKIVGNGMLHYIADNQYRQTPIYIEYNTAKLSMVTCDPLNGDKIDRTYNAYTAGGSFFAWWYIA